jgi:hypothetical protein
MLFAQHTKPKPTKQAGGLTECGCCGLGAKCRGSLATECAKGWLGGGGCPKAAATKGGLLRRRLRLLAEAEAAAAKGRGGSGGRRATKLEAARGRSSGPSIHAAILKHVCTAAGARIGWLK